LIAIDLRARDAGVTVHPQAQSERAMSQVADLQERIESQFTQWRYFNRSLRLFAENRVYLFKPLQMFHWLQSQALLDAAEVIRLVLNQAPEGS
jgi:hypothetical protein